MTDLKGRKEGVEKMNAEEAMMVKNEEEKAFNHFWNKITRNIPDPAVDQQVMEENGRIPEVWLEWFYRTKLFKFFVPSEFGGLEAPLPLALRTYEALSALDGNLGWLAQIGAGGGYFVPSFTHEVASSLFSNPKAVIAGTGFPAGSARKVPGGYLVSGMWKYASGAQYASLFTASALLLEENEEVQASKIRAFAFEPSQVSIIYDWDSFGLKGTSSHSFAVKDLFVPEEHSFIVGEVRHAYPYPLYRFPFDAFAVLSIGAVCIGLARGFFDRLSELYLHRQFAYISSAEEMMSRLRERFFREADRAWAEVAKGEALHEERSKEVGKAVIETAHEMRRIVQEIFPKLGMSVLKEENPLNRVYRDLETACHHVAIQDETD